MVKKSYNVTRKRKYKRKIYKKKSGPMKFVPRPITTEKKYIDTNISKTFDYNGAKDLLNGIATGNDFNGRIGSFINIRNIEIQGKIAIDTPATIKFALVYDKKPNGGTWATAALYTAISSIFPPYCLRNPENGERFVVLKNWSFNLMPQVSAANAVRAVKSFIKCNIPTQYTGTGATISNIVLGSLYLYMTSDTSTIASFNGTVRLRFSDS